MIPLGFTDERLLAELLEAIQALHRRIRHEVLVACTRSSPAQLSEVAEDDEGDTIYAIDRVSEELLVATFSELAISYGGLVLVAEGVSGGKLTLPLGMAESDANLLVIMDPIDGTRGLMYQKRSAWILTGVSKNLGAQSALSTIELAVQTEIPLVKQYLGDELFAVRGRGVSARRVNVLTGATEAISFRPSRAENINHGYAGVARFFPGARDELAAIDDEVCSGVAGVAQHGKALCFEDQYASTGGQLFELLSGHDRFIADLRPLMASRLAARGQPLGLCCHPYDLCTSLIAEELGVLLTAPGGAPLDAPLRVEPDVAWVGYANARLKDRIEPVLRAALEKRDLL